MRKKYIAARLGVALESVVQQNAAPAVEQPEQSPMPSMESELKQLDAVVVALESAQADPEMHALLFGPSVGLESGFSEKVKDTVNRLWEAFKALLKKIFSWGKSTEKKVEQVLEDAKEASGRDMNIDAEQAKQHSELEHLLHHANSVDEALDILEANVDKFDKLPVDKLRKLIKHHYLYFSSFFYGKDVRKPFDQLSKGVKTFSKDYDVEELEHVVLDVITQLSPKQDIAKANIVGGSAEFMEKVRTPNPVKKVFSFNSAGFKVIMDVLRDDLDNLFQNTVDWNETIEEVEADEPEYRDFEHWGSVARAAINVGRSMIGYVDRNADYLVSVLKYREEFEPN